MALALPAKHSMALAQAGAHRPQATAGATLDSTLEPVLGPPPDLLLHWPQPPFGVLSKKNEDVFIVFLKEILQFPLWLLSGPMVMIEHAV